MRSTPIHHLNLHNPFIFLYIKSTLLPALAPDIGFGLTLTCGIIQYKCMLKCIGCAHIRVNMPGSSEEITVQKKIDKRHNSKTAIKINQSSSKVYREIIRRCQIKG